MKKSKRILNKELNDYEYSQQKIVLQSAPYNFAVGLTNICQLQCPLCITGLRMQKKKLQYMDFEFFKEIIEKIKDVAILIQLYRWGEPLLHPQIIDILHYCRPYDLNIETSSNLSLRNIDDTLEAMVKYRLKRLVVAFDGVSQEQYQRYRIGGDLSLVKENIKKLNRFKAAYRSEYPRISLQYLKSKYTGNQIEILDKNYKYWGADDYTVLPMLSLRNQDKSQLSHWFTQSDIRRKKYMDFEEEFFGKVCAALYNFMVIEQDGTIPPCCTSYDPRDDFGKWESALELTDMFNSHRHILARKQFKECRGTSDILCRGCSVYLTYRETIHRLN